MRDAFKTRTTGKPVMATLLIPISRVLLKA